MSRTTPSTWTDLTPTLTAEKLEVFERQYKVALLDQDKSGDMEDEAFYDGWQSALEWVLDVLYDKKVDDDTGSKVVRTVTTS